MACLISKSVVDREIVVVVIGVVVVSHFGCSLKGFCKFAN